MKPKICPQMSGVFYWNHTSDVDQGPDHYEVECLQEKCEWWTRAYTDPENAVEYGCSVRINAMKNSEGKIPI